MWINDTSAFVAIEEKQFLPEVKQVITNNKDISVQDRILGRTETYIVLV